MVGPKLLAKILVGGFPENVLGFGVAAVRELGGTNPRLLDDVEVVNLLNGVDGFLDVGGDVGVEAAVRCAWLGVFRVGGGGNACDVSDLFNVGEGVEAPPSPEGGNKGGPSGARPFPRD